MAAFVTVMHQLGCPANVGMIVRTHVAMGGGDIVFVGLDRPCRDSPGTRRRSRVGSSDSATSRAAAVPLPDAAWPARPALVFGHEGRGLSDEFLARCPLTVVIPQAGPVAYLNVAASASIAMDELQRQLGAPSDRVIRGNMFWVEPADRVSRPGDPS